MTRAISFIRLRHMLPAVSEDVSAAGRAVDDNDDDQTARRAYVRAVFASIEGLTFALKHGLLERHPKEFTLGELAALAEENYVVGENGKLKTRSAFVSTPANVRFAFFCLAKAKRTDFFPILIIQAGRPSAMQSRCVTS